jgi:hypothetical protein
MSLEGSAKLPRRALLIDGRLREATVRSAATLDAEAASFAGNEGPELHACEPLSISGYTRLVALSHIRGKPPCTLARSREQGKPESTLDAYLEETAGRIGECRRQGVDERNERCRISSTTWRTT